MFAPVLFAGGISFCPGSQWGFFNLSFNLEVMLREAQRRCLYWDSREGARLTTEPSGHGNGMGHIPIPFTASPECLLLDSIATDRHF